MPNKWLEWTPDRDEIIPESSTREPSNPSEQGFDGFEDQPAGLFPIIQVHEDSSQAGIYAIEKVGDADPSKPSEPPAAPVPALVSDNGDDLWPPESIAAERRFGQPQARLFPFLGRKVRTPRGPGMLLQVLSDRVTVLLDSEMGKCAIFSPEDIRAVAIGVDD